jgi:uncharacterized small protein (DUF1192 family)
MIKYSRGLLMDIEEEESRTKGIETVDLEAMSIKALVAYLADLQSEIDRVETQIHIKKEARRGAETFFQ